MRLYLGLIFSVLFIIIKPAYSKDEVTLDYLIFDDTTPFHLKILDAIPDQGKIQIGPDNAKNTIIEFFDYFCGYCKKIHCLYLIASYAMKFYKFGPYKSMLIYCLVSIFQRAPLWAPAGAEREKFSGVFFAALCAPAGAERGNLGVFFAALWAPAGAE